MEFSLDGGYKLVRLDSNHNIIILHNYRVTGLYT